MSVSEDEKILSRCGLFEGCAEQTVNALLQGSGNLHRRRFGHSDEGKGDGKHPL